MIDPISSGAEFAIGKLFDHGARAYENAKFPGMIAKQVRERSNLRGVDFFEQQLADALRDGHVRSLLQRGGADDVTSARAKLRAVELYSQLREGESFEVFFAAVDRSLREHTNLAVLVADVQDEARARDLRSRYSDARRDKFDENLAGFPYPFREDLREINKVDGAVAVRLAADLHVHGARETRLAEWASVPPSWLPEDDPLVFGWLGELSTAADQPLAARMWIDRALKAGGTPRAYWKYLDVSNGSSVTDASIREALADVKDHSLSRAVFAGENLSERISGAEEWHPETAHQVAVREVLLVALWARAGRIDDAIDLGIQALDQRENFRAGLIAGEYLIHRAVTANLTSHASDLHKALEVGIQVRNAMRVFGLDSSEGVVLAVKANSVLGDFKSAWELTQVAPEGVATQRESEARNVADAAITILMNVGDFARAEQLTNETTRPHTSALVSAAAALRLDNEGDAIRVLEAALDSAQNSDEKAEVCLQLAHLGVEHTWLDELEDSNPKLGADLRLIALLYAKDSRAESRAKARAQNDRRIAFEYSRFLRKQGRYLEAGDNFARLGTKWNGRDDHFNAALCYLDVPDLAAALRSLGAAVVGSSNWPHLPQALRLQIQVATQLQDSDTAIAAARQLRELDPVNLDDRWLQVRVLYQAGSEADATTALTSGELAMPRSPEEAAVWLAIYRRLGKTMAPAELLREVALQFQASEGIKELSISCLLHAPGEVSSEEINIMTLHQDFESHEVGSSPLTIVDVAGLDGHEMLEKLEEVAGGAPSSAELEELIDAGTLPLGVFAGFTHRNMAETLVEGWRTPRYLSLPTESPHRVRVPRAHERAAIDLTAITTLARLPEELRELLASRFALQTSLMQYRDALVSSDALSVEATGRVLPSADALPPRFAETNPELQRILRQTSSAIVALMQSTNRPAMTGRQHPSDDFPEEFIGETWTLAGEMALDLELPLWCDDSSTRELLGFRGVASFSTLELIESLESSGDLPETEALLLRALLVDQRVVDVPFSERAYQAAVDLASNGPGGVGAALERSGPDSVVQKLALYVSASKTSAADPELLAQWADSAAKYASSLSQDVEALKGTLGYLFANWLGASWLDHSQFQIVTASIRRISPVSMTEVIEFAFPPVYEQFVKAFESSNAFSVMRHRVSLLPKDEQQAILWLMLKTSPQSAAFDQ